MASFRVALAYSYLNKYLTLVIHFVTTIILARLLTPADIGIYTVASVFVGLGHLLREFGINNYIVQEKDLTTDRIRAAFTLNLLFGWTVMGRPFVAPPAIPADRAAALRQAFDATMEDPAFLAETKKSRLDIDPLSGQDIEKFLAEIYKTPKPVVEKASAILSASR